MKAIIAILILISLQSSGQYYYVIPTMTNPETRAANISRKFYQLSRPVQGNDVTQYLFGWIKHPTNDSIALVIDSTFKLPKGVISATNITNWISDTYPTITAAQITTLTNYINSNTLLRISRLILTARIKLWTNAQMQARGWFDYPSPF